LEIFQEALLSAIPATLSSARHTNRFHKPIENDDLEAMAAQRGDGIIPVVWESKDRKGANSKTVLSSIKHDCQETLAEFLGNTQPLYFMFRCPLSMC
jgi:hypothetical protein